MDIPDISDDRPFKVRQDEFEKVCEQLQAWSRQYSGTYKTFDGMDKRRYQLLQTIPLVEKVITPLAKKMTGRVPDEPDSLAYKNAVVEFSRGPFVLSIHVEFDNAGEFQLEYSGKRLHTNIRCAIHEKSELHMVLFGPPGRATAAKSGMKALRPLSGARNFVTPTRLKKMVAAVPDTSYYCPFGDKELDDNFYLRALPVSLGNAFVADAKIRAALAQLPHLTMLAAGKCDWQYGSDETLVLTELKGYGGEAAFQSHLELVFSTLDLLESRKLLV
ncbi:MAG: hypothetical protein JST01_09405 [Cyanobacteria bacterium SZAS TMP-1]|nr:hypothetical protein [Cyanobacteria bacterium SZAS TMP-1]